MRAKVNPMFNIACCEMHWSPFLTDIIFTLALVDYEQASCGIMVCYKNITNKKVCLRERKRHTARRVEYSFCCPILADPPRLTPPGWPTPVVDPPLPWLTPPSWPPWLTTTPPPFCPPGLPPPPPILASHPPGWSPPPNEWVGWLTPPPPVDRQMDGQTRIKTLPSRRTTYAGGKYH